MKFDEVLLYSGGIDSFIGFHYLKFKPQLVYFNLNSKYTKKEIKNLPYKDLVIFDESLVWLGQFEQVLNAHVPFRNLYLAMTAVAKYTDIVYICGLKDDVMTDKNEKVFKIWSDHFSELEGRDIKILSPFWYMTKEDIIKWFDKEYDKKLLLDTVSCYSETDEIYCGRCQACFRKACALYSIGLELPFFDEKILNYYKSRLGKEIYLREREESIRRYLNFVQ